MVLDTTNVNMVVSNTKGREKEPPWKIREARELRQNVTEWCREQAKVRYAPSKVQQHVINKVKVVARRDEYENIK